MDDQDKIMGFSAQNRSDELIGPIIFFSVSIESNIQKREKKTLVLNSQKHDGEQNGHRAIEPERKKGENAAASMCLQ